MGCRMYLVRHGETIWNRDNRLQGQADIPLSETGFKQADALCARLANEKFTAIFSSDLKRAYLTASTIARPHHLEVQVQPGLREIDFGDWEGLTAQEIQARYPRDSAAWWATPLETRVPGGENLAELARRSTGAVKAIVERYPDEQVLVVAHGGTIRSIVGSALNLNLNQYWRLRQDNASLSLIEFHGWDKAILMFYNDCCHLKEM